jgi:hypothetical protein
VEGGGLVAKKKAFLLRIRPDLWEEISRWAADELRSTNGHIEFLLRQAVRARRGRELSEDTSPADPGDDEGVANA